MRKSARSTSATRTAPVPSAPAGNGSKRTARPCPFTGRSSRSPPARCRHTTGWGSARAAAARGDCPGLRRREWRRPPHREPSGAALEPSRLAAEAPAGGPIVLLTRPVQDLANRSSCTDGRTPLPVRQARSETSRSCPRMRRCGHRRNLHGRPRAPMRRQCAASNRRSTLLRPIEHRLRCRGVHPRRSMRRRTCSPTLRRRRLLRRARSRRCPNQSTPLLPPRRPPCPLNLRPARTGGKPPLPFSAFATGRLLASWG